MIRLIFLLFSTLVACAIFLRTAERFTHVDLPHDHQQPLLYANQLQDNLIQTYVQAIQSAKKSISVMIYSINDTSVIHALKEKANQGVEVMILCDGNATSHIKEKLGLDVKVYPIYDKGLMHLKILIVDHETLFIGSANLTRYSLKIHGNLVVGFYSPEAAQFAEKKAKEIASGQQNSHPQHKDFLVGGQKLEFWFLPSNHRPIERIIQLIDRAKKSVDVAMFTFTRVDFAEALIRASQRGVRVNVLIDNNSAKSSSKKIARLLYRNHISTRINTDLGLAHHKLLYIDQKTLVVGSANWTKAAFTKNKDCFIVIDHLNQLQQQQMNKLWKIILADSEKFKPR